MATSTIIQIADAVTDELNEAEWSLPFTAKRVYVPIHKLRALSDLTVSVVPKTLGAVILDRKGHNLYDYTIDIGIQKLIGDGSMTDDEINAAADPLMALAEEIIAGFFLELLDGFGTPSPRCIDANNEPIFAPDHLDKQRVFTSVVTLQYRMGK